MIRIPGALVAMAVFIGAIIIFRRSKPLLTANDDPAHRLELKELMTKLNGKHSVAPLALCGPLVIIYLALVLSKAIGVNPSVEELYRVGGSFGFADAHGQPWRIFSSASQCLPVYERFAREAESAKAGLTARPSMKELSEHCVAAMKERETILAQVNARHKARR